MRKWLSCLKLRAGVCALAVLLAGGTLLSFTTRTSADPAATAAAMTAFSGGIFEASGVAHVAGTSGVLFVDDGRPDEIFWMQLGENRTQNGPIKAAAT